MPNPTLPAHPQDLTLPSGWASVSAAAAGRSEWRARVLDDASVARLGISRQAMGGQGTGAPPSSSSSYSSSGGGPAGYHHVVKIMASTAAAAGGGSDVPDGSSGGGGGGHLGYDGTPLARVVGALSRPLNVRLVPYSGDPVLQVGL